MARAVRSPRPCGQRRILEPAALRRIGLGHALLLLRSAPPIMMTLTPWTDRADADQLAAARGRFEDRGRRPRSAGASDAPSPPWAALVEKPGGPPGLLLGLDGR